MSPRGVEHGALSGPLAADRRPRARTQRLGGLVRRTPRGDRPRRAAARPGGRGADAARAARRAAPRKTSGEDIAAAARRRRAARRARPTARSALFWSGEPRARETPRRDWNRGKGLGLGARRAPRPRRARRPRRVANRRTAPPRIHHRDLSLVCCGDGIELCSGRGGVRSARRDGRGSRRARLAEMLEGPRPKMNSEQTCIHG